jgi:hypothetical protein
MIILQNKSPLKGVKEGSGEKETERRVGEGRETSLKTRRLVMKEKSFRIFKNKLDDNIPSRVSNLVRL